MIGPAGHEIQNESYVPKKTFWLPIGNYQVFLVDGEEIRTNAAIDFTQGGHHKVFPFIPAREVWIERMKDPKEQYYTLVHELKEIVEMRGASYDTAHPKANELELKTRKEAGKKLPLLLGALAASGAGVAALKAQKEPVIQNVKDAEAEARKALNDKDYDFDLKRVDPKTFSNLVSLAEGSKYRGDGLGYSTFNLRPKDSSREAGVALVRNTGDSAEDDATALHEMGHLVDDVSDTGSRREELGYNLGKLDYYAAMKEAEKYGYASPVEMGVGRTKDAETQAEEFRNKYTPGRTEKEMWSVPRGARNVAPFRDAEDEAYMKNSSLVKEADGLHGVLKDLVSGAFSGLGSGLAAGVAVILYDKLQKRRKSKKASALADIAMLTYAYKLKKEAGWFKKPPVPKPTVIGEMHKAIPQMSMGKLLTANTLALLVAAGLMGVAEGAGMNAYEWGKEKYLKPPVMPEPEMKDPSIEV